MISYTYCSKLLTSNVGAATLDTLPIAINPASGEPIYRQIVDQVQRLVAGGVLAPGESLPSVRKVAQAFSVNPMTVSKAYGALEHSGVLVRRPGIGMLVAERTATPEELLAPDVRELVTVARELGLGSKDVQALIRKHWEDS